MTPPAALPTAAAPGPPLPAPSLPTPALPNSVRQLIGDLHRLPAQRPALLRVVQLADDPGSSLKRLADAVATDPAFTARLLELANSAYYGRAGRVTAIGPAVGVLGAEPLRGLAVSMVLGLAGENGPLPKGFWERAAVTAVGSRLMAPYVRADPGDAFCVGLLREVGQALLFRAAPHAYGTLLARCAESQLAAAERAWCGTTSAELAAAALRAAGLPDSVCTTIAQQQQDDRNDAAPTSPLTRALRGGGVLARAVANGEVDDEATAALGSLTEDAFDAQAARALALRAAAEAAAVSAAMR